MKNLTIELSKIEDQGRSRWRAAMPDLEVDATGSTISQALEALVDAIVDESLNVALTAMQAPLSTAPVDKPIFRYSGTLPQPEFLATPWTTNERLLGEDLRCGALGPTSPEGNFAPICTQRPRHAGDHVSWNAAEAWPQTPTEPVSAPFESPAAQHEAEGSPAVVGRYSGSEGPRWASTVYEPIVVGGSCSNCRRPLGEHRHAGAHCPVPG